MAALRFAERMTGTMYWLDDPLVERAIAVDIDANVRDLKSRVATVAGRIHADGLVADAPLQGTLSLHALRDRRIPYDLAFVDDRGRALHLRGEKDLSWLAPIETLVVLPFTIHESEREIARGTLRFDRTLRALAKSVRFAPL